MRHQTLKDYHYIAMTYPPGKGIVDITNHVDIKSI